MALSTSVRHLALTVTDVDRSVPWYVRVLGLEEVSQRDDPEGGLREAVLRVPEDGFAVVLVQHTHTERTGADQRHTGLDHVAFRVCSRAHLSAWEERLAEYGISHQPATASLTEPGAVVVTFHDPDGIRFEIWSDAE